MPRHHPGSILHLQGYLPTSAFSKSANEEIHRLGKDEHGELFVAQRESFREGYIISAVNRCFLVLFCPETAGRDTWMSGNAGQRGGDRRRRA